MSGSGSTASSCANSPVVATKNSSRVTLRLEPLTRDSNNDTHDTRIDIEAPQSLAAVHPPPPPPLSSQEISTKSETAAEGLESDEVSERLADDTNMTPSSHPNNIATENKKEPQTEAMGGKTIALDNVKKSSEICSASQEKSQAYELQCKTLSTKVQQTQANSMEYPLLSDLPDRVCDQVFSARHDTNDGDELGEAEDAVLIASKLSFADRCRRVKTNADKRTPSASPSSRSSSKDTVSSSCELHTSPANAPINKDESTKISSEKCARNTESPRHLPAKPTDCLDFKGSPYRKAVSVLRSSSTKKLCSAGSSKESGVSSEGGAVELNDIYPAHFVSLHRQASTSSDFTDGSVDQIEIEVTQG